MPFARVFGVVLITDGLAHTVGVSGKRRVLCRSVLGPLSGVRLYRLPGGNARTFDRATRRRPTCLARRHRRSPTVGRVGPIAFGLPLRIRRLGLLGIRLLRIRWLRLLGIRLLRIRRLRLWIGRLRLGVCALRRLRCRARRLDLLTLFSQRLGTLARRVLVGRIVDHLFLREEAVGPNQHTTAMSGGSGRATSVPIP